MEKVSKVKKWDGQWQREMTDTEFNILSCYGHLKYKSIAKIFEVEYTFVCYVMRKYGNTPYEPKYPWK